MAKPKKAAKPAPTESQITFIKAEYTAIIEHGRKALEHAIACGAALKDIQDNTEHGGWVKWVEDVAGIPRRTASHYMALAANQDELEKAAEALGKTVADLTVRNALELIDEYKASKMSPEDKAAAEAKEKAETAKKKAEAKQKEAEEAKAKKAEVEAAAKKLIAERPELTLVPPSPQPPPPPTDIEAFLKGRDGKEICVGICKSMEVEDLFKLASGIVRDVLSRTDITPEQWQLYKKGLVAILEAAKTPELPAEQEQLRKTGTR